MQEYGTSNVNLRQMIADHMENGFLENIIDMFRHDNSLYPLISALIQDERVRVRIGVTALIEELAGLDAEHIPGAVPGLIRTLDHTESFVRGDAANLLGIIGDSSALPHLKKTATLDADPNVRLLADEAIKDIEEKKP
ncbi:MAG: HEAT repeat domain-containing protein [Thermodesulfovibrio sp.]|nr:HEAT repeat domain-containing protein [Thermodesulfovibrio sp.]